MLITNNSPSRIHFLQYFNNIIHDYFVFLVLPFKKLFPCQKQLKYKNIFDKLINIDKKNSSLFVYLLFCYLND